MANIFEVTQYVLNEVFVRYVNYLSHAKVANRNLEGDFKNLKYATGQTINYRLEERFLGGEGATAVSEAVVQIVRPLTISKQFHTMVEFDGFELTFDRARDQPYLDMMLNPRVKRIANQVEQFIASGFQVGTYQAVGTPGVPVTFDTLIEADAYMTELGIPEDGNRYYAAGPRITGSMANDLSNTFNMTVNRAALMDGFVGHLTGFDIFKTNFYTRQVAGIGGGGSIVNGFIAAGTVVGPIIGGNTIPVTGLPTNAAVFNVGDSIEIDESAGVFMINPLNYEPLVQRAQFVVTANVISDNSGNANIPVNPTIVIDGARQNISAAIPNGAQILLAASHNVSIAFHNQSIVFAGPPIKELKGGVEVVTTYSDLYKMAMTYTLGADIRNYQQLDRVDTLAGAAFNWEFAVRVRS